MDVFLTVDVEIWCSGWTELDARFPSAFEKYIYGRTKSGEAGLPYQARVLNDAGLTAVFFVEPLFAERFGHEHLREIVSLLQAANQEVQLHLHPEWADEVDPPMVPLPKEGRVKRPLLKQYPRADQHSLIARGLGLLESAGAGRASAFRAGGFGFDLDTLHALKANGVSVDSSYNASMHGLQSGLARGERLLDVYGDGPVLEVPMTVYEDGFGRLRHAQLGACSWSELESLLWRGAEAERKTFVILSHNFELLSPAKTRIDPVVDRRFRKLVQFLARHRDVFRTRGFRGWVAPPSCAQPARPLRSGYARACARLLEQAWRRAYR